MIAQRQGSTCLPLDPSPRGHLRTLVTEIARLAGLDGEAPALVRAIGRLTGRPQFNSVVGTRDQRLPLIVDDGCLYTERSRWLEDRVARRLAERLAAPATDPAAVLADLARRPAGAALSDEQAAAVGLAIAGKLAMVTGGPGTGKTLVAAAIVRGLARLGITQVALAAQTGKAANRLTEVIGEQLAAIRDPGDADRALAAAPPAAQTLHRLLGYRGERFAHHAQSPLPFGAVIVDEASMIDLELVDALLDALPPGAPLVLIGDAHQLPAIDAGQILADLATPDGPARRAGRRAPRQLPHGHRRSRRPRGVRRGRRRPRRQRAAADRAPPAARRAAHARHARVRRRRVGRHHRRPRPAGHRARRRRGPVAPLRRPARAARRRARVPVRRRPDRSGAGRRAGAAVAPAVARPRAHRHPRAGHRLARDQRPPPRARARPDVGRPAAPSWSPASR